MITATGENDWFVNRWKRGLVPNPKGFIQLAMVQVVSPFDLRGVLTSMWTYKDEREDTCLTYIAMLRRVRRTSASARSDPFAGTLFCYDDDRGWAGKNQEEWGDAGDGTSGGWLLSSVCTRGRATDLILYPPFRIEQECVLSPITCGNLRIPGPSKSIRWGTKELSNCVPWINRPQNQPLDYRRLCLCVCSKTLTN